jgi:hypothetical protein
MKALTRRNRLVLAFLISVAFTIGLLTPITSGQVCQIIQGTCSYRVTGYYCKPDLCGLAYCAERCCYYEYGFCVSDPYRYMFSQICGGRCARYPEP